MRDALKVFFAALALGVVSLTWVYQRIVAYRLEGAASAALAASFPFFSVAVLALLLTLRRRTRPDTRIINSGIRELVRLLVLSGVWVFVVLLVWGL